jgi:SAM-dependent methyltransferase
MNSAPLPDIAEYYERHADIYTRIGLDRDIEAQVEAMAALGGPKDGLRYLELFAGPAYHAIAAAARPGIAGFAIDTSAAMKEQALRLGFRPTERYVIGSVLDLEAHLGAAGPFHLISALRYSVGYLSRPQLRAMLAQVAALLAPGGFLVIELHRIGLIMRGLNDLGILERTAENGDGSRAVCRWPAGPPAFDDDDFRARMRVEVDLHPPSGEPSRLAFESRELIFSRGSIDDAAAGLGLIARHDAATDDAFAAAFPDSVIAIYAMEADRV